MGSPTCQDYPDPDLWFPSFWTPREDIVRAQEICQACPVMEACRKLGKGEYGIWGGKVFRLDSDPERRLNG